MREQTYFKSAFGMEYVMLFFYNDVLNGLQCLANEKSLKNC